MAKNIDSLRESKKRRKEIIDKYGDVPTSVWDIEYKKNSSIMELATTQTILSNSRESIKKSSELTRKSFAMSGRSIRDGESMSVFPPLLVRRVILFYTQENDIVLDPFAGHNSRMQVTNLLNRGYVGYDVSKKNMDFNLSVKKKIKSTGIGLVGNKDIVLRCQSSERLEEASNSIDFIFTSPPYYDLEFYGDEQEQLGKAKTYNEFIGRMQIIIKECFRVLKPDSFIVFNVNDFRRKGIFHPYHSDIISCYQNVGFALHDIIVLKYKNCIGQCFATQIEDRKATAKIHEYLIVGRKL